MNQKRMQFLLDITLPEGNADGEPVLPACNGDIAEWFNQVKSSFPGLVATLSPVESSKPVSKPRRHDSGKKVLPARPSLDDSRSTNFAPDLDGFEQLTSRQKDIVNLLFKGCSYREIGKNLGISLPTVRAHLHSAYKRLQVRSRAQAVAKIFRQRSENSAR
jgi:DNA-binding CsgD family transcriptional regulator